MMVMMVVVFGNNQRVQANMRREAGGRARSTSERKVSVADAKYRILLLLLPLYSSVRLASPAACKNTHHADRHG